MRLWSVHPKYLDAKGLVALWREGLLAQSVLLGNTKGYINHPQLIRFKDSTNPVGAIAQYLKSVAHEADNRGYNFNKTKIVNVKFNDLLNVTSGQIEFEFKHLLKKLSIRNPELYQKHKNLNTINLHPLFKQIKGNVENWEIV